MVVEEEEEVMVVEEEEKIRKEEEDGNERGSTQGHGTSREQKICWLITSLPA